MLVHHFTTKPGHLAEQAWNNPNDVIANKARMDGNRARIENARKDATKQVWNEFGRKFCLSPCFLQRVDTIPYMEWGRPFLLC